MLRLPLAFILDGSLDRRYQIPCIPKFYRCKLSARRSRLLKKQQVSVTTQITGRSIWVLSTTSDSPSTGSLLPPELLVTPMTIDNALAVIVNSSYKNELIHTRR